MAPQGVFGWPGGSRIAFACEVFVCYGFRIGGFEPARYRREVTIVGRYQNKCMVRIVIDCPTEQADRVQKRLELLYADGQIVFGLHGARQALMTCVTPDIVNGRHLHHIDATEGGFWGSSDQVGGFRANSFFLIWLFHII